MRLSLTLPSFATIGPYRTGEYFRESLMKEARFPRRTLLGSSVDRGQGAPKGAPREFDLLRYRKVRQVPASSHPWLPTHLIAPRRVNAPNACGGSPHPLSTLRIPDAWGGKPPPRSVACQPSP